MIGAVIDATDREELVPGVTDVPVSLRFWAEEEARHLALPGATFGLWYSGRAVGHGRISDTAAADGLPNNRIQQNAGS
jgi:hypothetical protein